MKTMLCALLILLSGSILSQSSVDTSLTLIEPNPHLWNSLVITSIQNPALAGLTHQHHLYFDYDQPWFSNYDAGFNRSSYRVGYDWGFNTANDKLRIGIGVYYSGESLKNTKENSVGIVNSFIIKFRNKSELGIGISVLAITFNSIDFTNLRFGINYDPTAGGHNSLLPNGEIFFIDHYTGYGPLNLGIWYKAKNFFIGTSSVNLTAPYESIYEGFTTNDRVRTPIISYTNIGYHFTINNRFTITPSLQYQTETIFGESFDPVWFHSVQPRATFSFSKDRFMAGTYYENDAMYVLAGADLFHHHWLISLDAGWYVIDDIDTGMQGFKVKTRVHF